MIDYEILASGSKGNATILDSSILIDCGVPYRRIEPHVKELKLVLLTHSHSDHFNTATIHRLAKERPTLRLGCCEWLVGALLLAGVSKWNIDVYQLDTVYNYGSVRIKPVYLPHNVPNCGYKLHFKAEDSKVIYCTDCGNLNGITAQNYDLYLIEANHDADEISRRIKEKEMNGEYAYEIQAQKNHLSRQKCDEFIYANAGQNSVFVYMHCHDD